MKMKQPIHPVQLIESIPKGYSKPQRILFSDGRTYAVKFKNNPSGTRILVNEYISGKLAQLLSLPVVPFEVVEISDDFIKGNPVFSKYKFKSGNQFASLFIDNCIHLSKDSPKQVNINNRNHLAGIIAFDLWIGNTDRKEGNVLLEPRQEGEYYLHIIDHGRIFADAKWTIKTLKKIPKKMVIDQRVHKWFVSQLQSENEIHAAIEKILDLPDEMISDVIDSIPDDWDVSKDERVALVDRLINTKQLLSNIKLRKKK
jgi:hypothetical protein